jgi:hypothetical protein
MFFWLARGEPLVFTKFCAQGRPIFTNFQEFNGIVG